MIHILKSFERTYVWNRGTAGQNTKIGYTSRYDATHSPLEKIPTMSRRLASFTVLYDEVYNHVFCGPTS